MSLEDIGDNIKYKIEGNKLLLSIDISKRLRKSKSGKTTIIASSNGNPKITDTVHLGLNCYTKE